MSVVQEGKEPLPCCDVCSMHIPEWRLVKYHRTNRYNRNMHMRWRRRDVTMASQFTEASFSLTEEYEAECIEGVRIFEYLGQMLDRSDEYWPKFRRNISKACRLWGLLVKILRRGGGRVIGHWCRRCYSLGHRPGCCQRQGQDTVGGPRGFPWSGYRKYGETKVGQNLKEGIIRECPQRIRDS